MVDGVESGRISEISYICCLFCVKFSCHGNGNGVSQQPPTRCKDLDDISYTNWVIVYFISNFVAMATGVGRGGFCLTAFNSPTPKTPCCVQESRRYLPQKPSYCLFCFKFNNLIKTVIIFIIKFSLPWQQGLVVVEFVWRHSIAQRPKPPTRRKHLVDISQTS